MRLLDNSFSDIRNNSFADTQNVSFSETLNLYSSSTCVSESFAGPILFLIASLLYATISLLMGSKHKTKKIVDLTRFLIQIFLWLTMLVFSILTFIWFVSGTDEKAIVNVTDLQPNSINTTFTGVDSETDLPFKITTEIFPNINSGLEYYISDTGSYFPMTMSCSLMGFVNSITQTIDYINNNNITNIFDPSKADVTTPMINDTTICNTDLTVQNFDYISQQSNYTNNLPTDVSSVANNLVYVIVQGALVMLSFLLSIWSCIGDVIRYKNNIQAS